MAKKLEQRAQDYLERNDKVVKLFATSDDFLFENKQSALAHASTLEGKDVKTFNKAKKQKPSEDKTAKPFMKQNETEILESVKTLEDAGLIEAYILEELNNDKPREKVIEALEAQFADLKK